MSAGEISADRSAGLDTGRVMVGGGTIIDTMEAKRDVFKEVGDGRPVPATQPVKASTGRHFNGTISSADVLLVFFTARS